MIVEIEGQKVKLLGDPHLGRRFIAGVPLHRRGEREATMWAEFQASLEVHENVTMHICMGDLFERSHVPYDAIMDAASIYTAAAKKYPDVRFVVLKGNHDWLRDLDSPSAFDVFNRCAHGVVDVIDHPISIGTWGFFPWHPTMTAKEAVASLEGDITVAFGHWDVDPRSHEHNLIPAKDLINRKCRIAYTGHDHTARRLTLGGLETVVTGSMQPYSHGEDSGGRLYVTYNLEDVRILLENYGEDYFHQKCLRVDVGPNEQFNDDVDCLQLTVRKLTSDGDPDEGRVELGAFDLKAILKESFEENGVEADTASAVEEHLEC